MTTTPPATPASTNWLDRNWKWFVPVAGLAVFVLVAGFIGGILLLVFGAMKSADAYQMALSRARDNPAVLAALGSPIKDGFFPSGSINVSGSSGEAKLAIPVSGPKGEGTLHVEAKKSAGQWTLGVLVLEVAGSSQRINLLGGKAALPPPAYSSLGTVPAHA